MTEHFDKLQFKNCTGEIAIVPSKSETHRAIIAAALAKGDSVIKNASLCEDTYATIECVRAMGAQVNISGNMLYITGINSDTLNKFCEKNSPVTLNCRESASTMRFLLPAALMLYKDVIIKGTGKLIERGIGVYEEVFKESKVNFYKSEKFIRVAGEITQKEFVVRGDISSQYISGLLFVMPMLTYDGKLTITGDLKSAPYVDMTLEILKSFGIEAAKTKNDKKLYFVPGNRQYKNTEFFVSGDWSNAAFFVALNHLGAKIKINGLDTDTTQGDKICGAFFDELDRTENLIETKKHAVIDIGNTIDLGPILIAYAAIKNGGVFVGTERLKNKESDRASVMREELLKFGIKVRVEQNRVVVEKGELKMPVVPVDSHNDHRIVMALVLLLLYTGGDVEGSEAVNKSYPGFFDDLARIMT